MNLGVYLVVRKSLTDYFVTHLSRGQLGLYLLAFFIHKSFGLDTMIFRLFGFFDFVVAFVY